MVNIDVMTYCSGYESFIFERFIGSLYDTGFNGNTYIIGQENDSKIVQELQKKYNNIRFFNDKFSLPVRYNMRRFFMFEYIVSLMNKGDIKKPDYLLICDGRDVLFQKNIEKYDYRHNLYFAEEQIKFTQDPKYNVQWLLFLERILSEKFYDKIKHNHVLCSGTTIGNFESIYKYIKLMCNVIKEKNWGSFHGDQGIHNYLYYTNKYDNYIENIKILKNKENLINTIGAPLSLKIQNLSSFIIKNGKICDNTNNEEEVSYIVHQWDRLNEDDRKQISNKYNFIKTR
jgi:hypothetical protein